MSFFERLEARAADSGSLLCVGLDPRVETAAEARRHCMQLIEETAPYAAAFKPNSAFFEALGPGGFEVLAEVVAAVPDKIPVLVDAKRGDIGPTAEAYAAAVFGAIGAAAVTVSPYLGLDALAPFLERGDVFVLCRTSNPGGAEFQEMLVTDGEPLFVALARAVADRFPPERAGLVVGATEPGSIAQVRSVVPDHWILAPGVGAQRGSLEEALAAGLRADGGGVLVPVSRSIAAATDAGEAAAALVERIRAGRAQPGSQRVGPGLEAELFDAGCVRFGDFELKSGVRSPVYLDLRTLAGHPRLLRRVARAYLPLLGGPDRIAGVPLAGFPLATAVSLESGIPMVYPRPPKDHGTMATVEGPFQPGERVTIVDDVATSGISVLEAAERLREQGLIVERAVVLVDRGQGAADALAAQGIELQAVLDLLGVVGTLERVGRVGSGEAEAVRAFLDDTASAPPRRGSEDG